MQARDTSNTLFQLALDLVNHTTQHLFLTGKAGTGKTTFLRYVKEHTRKRAVVVAPTGVAAINAAGVTMHSFFQLPLGIFIPGSFHRSGQQSNVEVTDRHSLFKNIRLSKEKRTLLEELELLIIDEVSMMRCDMLDAIDAILRHFRKNAGLPFGGVQVLYIGDLFQLPPVVQGDEWSLLQQHYESPFFFSAKVMAEAKPLYVELQKIYRQNEQAFIDILNRIRNNAATPLDLETLNERCRPDQLPDSTAPYITITTHNRKADQLNRAELDRLPGSLHTFRAELTGDFSDKALPTDRELQLKEGAQVMFIKNDAERRFYNGRIATIKWILNDEITVSFPDGSADLKLEKETWKNIRYTYNKENDDIEEEELGSFKQYPVRLAWAITVHKSQGLTFDRAVIDAGSSFAPGQVYVALSRCTSMEGMILRSRIHAGAIATDPRVLAFAQEAPDEEVLFHKLEQEKYRFWAQELLRLFDWSKLVTQLWEWVTLVPEKKLSDVEGTLKMAQDVYDKARQGAETARKFQMQLAGILDDMQASGRTEILSERMGKAIGYFAALIGHELLQPVQDHLREIHHNARVKRYKMEVRALEGFIWQQLQRLITAHYGTMTFFHDFALYQRFNPAEQPEARREAPRGKPEKGSSQELTLELFSEGKSIEEIATLRNLAISTIEGHLAGFVREGRLQITEVVPSDKVEHILEVMNQVGTESLGLIKNKLGDEYTFGEIRAVLNHRLFAQQPG